MIIEKRKISELNPAPYNPRKSDVTQEANLKASLEKFGVVEPIIFNKQTGFIVGGHFRIRELKKLGIKEVDCVIVDLSPEDEKELNIRLNANTGEWDWLELQEWDNELLEEWGLEMVDFDNSEKPLDKEWADAFDAKNNSNSSQGKQQITFVLDENYIKKLKEWLKKYDINKDTALKMVINEIYS